jgi:isopenicillin-N epimerase
MNCNYRNLKTLARFSAPDRTLSGFAWDGCRNYSAFLTIPSALKFWSQYNDNSLANNGLSSDDVDGARRGSAVVRSYCNGLINEAVDAMKRDWNLDEALFSHESLTKDLPMRLVPLPALVNGKSTRNNCTDVDAFNLQEELHYQHRIEVPIKCLEGRLYVRISAHVYNEISEYYKLIKIINSYT